MPEDLSMYDERGELALLQQDVVSTLGGQHRDLVAHYAATQREFASGGEFVTRVAEEVQQELMDTFVDTTWPACPQQPNHPLWFHAGAWCCTRDQVRIPLGDLGTSRREV
ncbi:MAG: hypothetical protein ACR2M1_06610 [Gemmatimonadaceae bacterium]